MTATEIAIRPHDIATIEPEALIAQERITLDVAESDRRGREFSVYVVPSQTVKGKTYLVCYNDKTRRIYCECKRAQCNGICAHVRSVLFKREYTLHYRLYHIATLPELQASERDYIETERGTLVPVRGWRAQWAAIADLIWERTRRAA